jgi:hypothetical protein
MKTSQYNTIINNLNNSNPKFFIITCHGWSASNWLAYCLNLHPNITCGHSGAAILANDPNYINIDGLKKNFRVIREGCLQRQTRSILETYHKLQKQKNAPFIGTVHSYRLRDLPFQQRNFSFDIDYFRTVNLVRHPLDLVISGYGQFKDLFKMDINEFSFTISKLVNQGLDIVDSICIKYNLVPGDFNNLCFFSACVILGSLRLDLDALETIQKSTDNPWNYQGTVRMEEITQSPTRFSKLIEQITNKNDLVSKEYINNIYNIGRVNIHNKEASLGIIQRWNDLKKWQKETFVLFFRRFNIQSSYESMGYNFDFINNWNNES